MNALNVQVAHPTKYQRVYRIYDGHDEYAPGFYFADDADILTGTYSTADAAAIAYRDYMERTYVVERLKAHIESLKKENDFLNTLIGNACGTDYKKVLDAERKRAEIAEGQRDEARCTMLAETRTASVFMELLREVTAYGDKIPEDLLKRIDAALSGGA